MDDHSHGNISGTVHHTDDHASSVFQTGHADGCVILDKNTKQVILREFGLTFKGRHSDECSQRYERVNLSPKLVKCI